MTYPEVGPYRLLDNNRALLRQRPVLGVVLPANCRRREADLMRLNSTGDDDAHLEADQGIWRTCLFW